MIRSMTGYGRSEYTVNDRTFTVEIKTVNHKYNEIWLKTPRILNILESRIREYLRSKIYRGKIDIFIKFSSTSLESKKLSLDNHLADAYVNVLSQLKDRFGLNDNVTLSLLTRFPDIISVEEDETSEDELWSILEPCLEQALSNLINMREKEGEALKQDLLLRLKSIECWLKEIEEYSSVVVQEYRQRLTNRISELLKDTPVDEQRIAMEIAIMADKSNITEEITRLYSHISQMKNALNDSENIGKKLNFIVQEMNRESNTINSKTGDLRIINKVLEIKNEVENIREQIQNIE